MKTVAWWGEIFRRSSSGGRWECRTADRSGKGLWEVRSDLTGGRIGRVIFFIKEGEMVLLHAFEKKTQRTPRKEIDIALKRKHEVQ